MQQEKKFRGILGMNPVSPLTNGNWLLQNSDNKTQKLTT